MRTFLRHPITLLSALYTLAWGPMLAMRGIYWDGWVYASQYIDPDFAYIWSTEFGPQRQYHHYAIFRLIELTPDPIFVTRLIVFASWLVAGILLYRILTNALHWDAGDALIVAAYYLIFPTFLVRFEIIHPYYSLANVFFVAAWYFYFFSRRRIFEIIPVLLFIASFFVYSFTIFFFGIAAVHAYAFAHKHSVTKIVPAIRMYVKHYWYLLALPIVFLLAKFTFLKPYGAAALYNEPIIFRENASIISTLFTALDGLWSGIWTALVWPIASNLMLLERKYFLAAFVLASIFIYFLSRGFATLEDRRISLSLIPLTLTKSAAYLIAGTMFSLIALIPYIAVGKPPHIYGYGFGIRHTLLFPLCCALLMVGLGYLLKDAARMRFHLTAFSLSIAAVWYMFFLLDIDAYKQKAIITVLSPIVTSLQPGMLFVFDDKTPGLDWNGRNISRQEYDGYLEKITGSHEYHGISLFEYNAHQPTASSTLVTITSNRTDDPRVTDWLKIKAVELSGGDVNLRAQQLLEISLTPSPLR